VSVRPAEATVDVKSPLPMERVRDVVVDDAHGHVFVASETVIAVRTRSGGPVSTISGFDGITRMSLSPDAGTLWVALQEEYAVAAIDTTTLTVRARYALGTQVCPYGIAAGPTAVWFTYGCAAGGDIGVIDLSGETPSVVLTRTGGTVAGAELVISPADPTLLVVGSGSSLVAVRATGTALSKIATAPSGGYAGILAITADGTRVIESGLGVFSLPDLTRTGTLPPSPYGSVALAVSPSGVVASATFGPYEPEDIRVLTAAGAQIRRYDFGNGNMAENGLAFGADGVLYATRSEGVRGYLHVLHDPDKLASSISLAKPPPARLGTAFTVTGKVSAAAPIAAGTTIHVYRTSTRYGTKSLPDVTTGSGGAFSFSDTVYRRGLFTYTAHWDGDATRGGASAGVTTEVMGLVPHLTVSTNAAIYAYGGTAKVTARLGTTFANRVVTLRMTPYGQATTMLKSGAVDANGNISASVTITRRTTFSASFAGDDVYVPRTVRKGVWARVVVATSLDGSYGSSGSYRLYRRTVDPVLTIAVRPNKRRTCARFVAQRHYAGAWHTIDVEPCATLDDYSRVAASLAGDPYVGSPYRLRASWLNDGYNATTLGVWHYLRFTT
jgi:hypothetical protein